jgi:hypothetical protein
MSLLKTKVIVPEKLNGLYSCTVLNYSEVENDKGGFIRVTFKVTENRNYDYIIFPSESDGLSDENGNLRVAKWIDEAGKEHKGSQLNYVISSLSNQLGMHGELDLVVLLEAAKEDPIGVAFAYNQDLGRTNVSFRELVKDEEAVAL